MFLLDEPQDFLHPFLERRLMEIIEQSPHRFLIATHSARAYDLGRGVLKDLAVSVTWYRKAAEQGDADAQFNLGGLYADGQGVKRSYAQAARWYRRAAEQGHAWAQTNLGLMYRKGHVVRRTSRTRIELRAPFFCSSLCLR
jgi:TPR repeat protein